MMIFRKNLPSEEEIKAREMDKPRQLGELSIHDSTHFFGHYDLAFWYLVGQFSHLTVEPEQQLELWKLGIKMFDEVRLGKIAGKDRELVQIAEELKARNGSK